MKKERNYNQFTKSDIPLDVSLNLPVTDVKKTTKTTTSKPKINAIVGKKTKSGTTSKAGSSTTSKSNSKLRTKLKTDDVSTKELEKLNEESLKTYNFKSRRNSVIIVVLSILLALSLVFIAITAITSQYEDNCKIYTYGADATTYINGKEDDGFIVIAGTTGNTTLGFDLEMKINASGNYNVRYTIKCYQGETLIENTLPYNPDPGVTFKYNKNGYFEGMKSYSGGQNILLLRGVILDRDYEHSLSSTNIKLEIHVYISNANA